MKEFQEAKIEHMLCSGLVRSRAEHSMVWACFWSSVNASAQAECMLGMENLAGVDGPTIAITQLRQNHPGCYSISRLACDQ